MSVSISKSNEDCLGDGHSDTLAVEQVDSRLCIVNFGIFVKEHSDGMSGVMKSAGSMSSFVGVVIEWAELLASAGIKSGFIGVVIE